MYLRFKDENSSNLKEGQVYSLMGRIHLSHVESSTKATKTSMPIPIGRSVQGRCLGVLETHSRLEDNYEVWIEMIKTSCIDVETFQRINKKPLSPLIAFKGQEGPTQAAGVEGIPMALLGAGF